jgi:hypothetical protein
MCVRAVCITCDFPPVALLQLQVGGWPRDIHGERHKAHAEPAPNPIKTGLVASVSVSVACSGQIVLQITEQCVQDGESMYFLDFCHAIRPVRGVVGSVRRLVRS